MKLFKTTKPAKLLMKLNSRLQKKSMSQVLRECDCTYSYGSKCFSELEHAGLILVEKPGRDKFFTLTKKGYEVTEHLVEIKWIMNNDIFPTP